MREESLRQRLPWRPYSPKDEWPSHGIQKEANACDCKSSFGADLAFAGKQPWLEGSCSLAVHLRIHSHVLSVVPTQRQLL